MSIQRLTSVERAGLLVLAAVMMVAAVVMALLRNSDSNTEWPAEPAVAVDSLPGDAVRGDSVSSAPPRRRVSAKARPVPAEAPVRNPLDDTF